MYNWKIWELIVLNLIINGLPSIHKFIDFIIEYFIRFVLNLIINGLPSILSEGLVDQAVVKAF